MLTILPMIVLSFLLPVIMPLEMIWDLFFDQARFWELFDILKDSVQEGIAGIPFIIDEMAGLVKYLFSIFI